MTSNVIDTVEQVRNLVERVEILAKPLIFIDLEGVNLSRDGVLAIMQILVPPQPVVHLVDVHTLRKDAFDVSGSGGQSLRSILESKAYAKVFFDVRNDSDALYSHYQISLSGDFSSKVLPSVISEDGGLGWTGSQKWQRIKDAGQRLFAPEKGGSYEVFLERPLSTSLQEYCAQDVLVMPKLLSVYGGRVPHGLAEQINAETLARVILSQSANFNGKGRHMAVGPSFNWGRSCDLTALEFPMILICSTGLADQCALNEVIMAEAGITKELRTVEKTNVKDLVENAKAAITMDAPLSALKSLKIDEPSTGQPVVEGGNIIDD